MGMKKIVLLIFPLWLLTACGPMKPQTVATKYLTALSSADFDEARMYITFRSFAAFEQVKVSHLPGEYELVALTPVSDDLINLQYINPSQDTLFTCSLVQRNGRWRIDLEP
jgi:hypothetical protein